VFKVRGSATGGVEMSYWQRGWYWRVDVKWQEVTAANALSLSAQNKLYGYDYTLAKLVKFAVPYGSG